MTVGELIGELTSAMGRGEISLKSIVNVDASTAANPDTKYEIVGIDTDVDGDEVSLTLTM